MHPPNVRLTLILCEYACLSLGGTYLYHISLASYVSTKMLCTVWQLTTQLVISSRASTKIGTHTPHQFIYFFQRRRLLHEERVNCQFSAPPPRCLSTSFNFKFSFFCVLFNQPEMVYYNSQKVDAMISVPKK